MDLNLSDRTLKHILLLGSGLVLGYWVYSEYRIWRKRHLKSIDEGFEDDSKVEEIPKKRILVLGLENAGKSAFVKKISSSSGYVGKDLEPTDGFIVSLMLVNNMTINIWDVGGSGEMRKYWPNFLQDTDLLVFVVDASDIHNLSLAVREVKWLLADERLANVPVLVIANKQDKPNAIPPEQVADALDLGSIHPLKHKIKVLGTQCPPESKLDPPLSKIEEIIYQLLVD